MAEDIGALVARVVADTEQFRSEMVKLSSQVSSNTASMNRALASIKSNVGSLGSAMSAVTSIAATFGVALSTRALLNFAASTIEAAANLSKLAERLGASVESLSELEYVAKLADVSSESLTSGLQRMQRSIGQAALGSQQINTAFLELGLNARALSKIPLDKQFEVIAEALSRVGNESVRASISQQIFGRGALEMLQIVNQGATAIREQRQELRDLGGVMTTETAQGAQDAKDAMDKIKASAEGLTNILLNKLGPAIAASLTGWRIALAPTQMETLQAQLRETYTHIDELKRKLDDAKAGMGSLGWMHDLIFGPGKRGSDIAAEIDAAKAKALEFLQQITGMQGAKGKAAAEDNKPPAGVGLSLFDQMLAAVGSAQETNIKNMGGMSTIGQGPGEAMDKFKEAVTDLRDFQIQSILDVQSAQFGAWGEMLIRERQVIDFRKEMQLDVANAAIGLLQVVGAKHRGAAIAAIAIEKGLAVARIIMNTHVAVMNAMATLPYPANIAAAAAVRTMGFVEAGLVAATGAAQISQLSSGGVSSGLGTAANPIFTSTAGNSAASTAAGSASNRSAVTLIFQGNMYGWDDYVRNKVIAGIRDAIDGKDVVIIGPDSRQAQILLGGG